MYSSKKFTKLSKIIFIFLFLACGAGCVTCADFEGCKQCTTGYTLSVAPHPL